MGMKSFGAVLLILLAGIALGEPPASDSLTPFTIELRVDDAKVIAGEAFPVGVFCPDTTGQLGGFNLLIEYDFAAIVFDSATFGKSTLGEWEYLNVNSGFKSEEDLSDNRAWIRLVAIADSHNDPRQPSARSLVGPGELARLYLYAADGTAGDSTALRFFWRACGDNTFSDLSGNKLMIGAEVDSTAGDSLSYKGPAVDCLGSKRNPPLQLVRFKNVWLRPQAPKPLPTSND